MKPALFKIEFEQVENSTIVEILVPYANILSALYRISRIEILSEVIYRGETKRQIRYSIDLNNLERSHKFVWHMDFEHFANHRCQIEFISKETIMLTKITQLPVSAAQYNICLLITATMLPWITEYIQKDNFRDDSIPNIITSDRSETLDWEYAPSSFFQLPYFTESEFLRFRAPDADSNFEWCSILIDYVRDLYDMNTESTFVFYSYAFRLYFFSFLIAVLDLPKELYRMIVINEGMCEYKALLRLTTVADPKSYFENRRLEWNKLVSKAGSKDCNLKELIHSLEHNAISEFGLLAVIEEDIEEYWVSDQELAFPKELNTWYKCTSFLKKVTEKNYSDLLDSAPEEGRKLVEKLFRVGSLICSAKKTLMFCDLSVKARNPYSIYLLYLITLLYSSDYDFLYKPHPLDNSSSKSNGKLDIACTLNFQEVSCLVPVELILYFHSNIEIFCYKSSMTFSGFVKSRIAGTFDFSQLNATEKFDAKDSPIYRFSVEPLHEKFLSCGNLSSHSIKNLFKVSTYSSLDDFDLGIWVPSLGKVQCYSKATDSDAYELTGVLSGKKTLSLSEVIEGRYTLTSDSHSGVLNAGLALEVDLLNTENDFYKICLTNNKLLTSVKNNDGSIHAKWLDKMDLTINDYPIQDFFILYENEHDEYCYICNGNNFLYLTVKKDYLSDAVFWENMTLDSFTGEVRQRFRLTAVSND